MGCKPSTVASQSTPPGGGVHLGPPQPKHHASVEAQAAPNNRGNAPILRLSTLKPDLRSAFSSPRASLSHGFTRLKGRVSNLRASVTPVTTPGPSPRKADTATPSPGSSRDTSNNAINEAEHSNRMDVVEAKGHAVSGALHSGGGGDGELSTAQGGGLCDAASESDTHEEPTLIQLRALWILMKINAAPTTATKMRWLHDLEWLLVSLDPLEPQHPSRSILVEAKAAEMCLANLREGADDLQLCVSCMAVLVHLSLAKEASARLQAIGGIDTTAKLLKRSFARLKKLLKAQQALAHSVTEDPAVQELESVPPATAEEPREVNSFSEAPRQEVKAEEETPPGWSAPAEIKDETARGTPDDDTGPQLQVQAPASEEAAAPSPLAASVSPPESQKQQPSGSPQQVLKRVACNVLPLLRQQKKKHNMDPNLLQDRRDQIARDIKLVVEFITLIWRLVFATSLDGDEFAQRWVSAGAAEHALEALSSTDPVFSDCAFVCWTLGALRFMPLANPYLSESFVQSRNLLSLTVSRMKPFSTDSLVLENGFAVLANFQRRQPNNSKVLSKQRAEAWGECVEWLMNDASMQRVDVLFQGLFAIGLGCSYCPEALKRVREAGGLELTERVMQVYGGGSRSVNVPSTADPKVITLQQFAEGLKMLLLRASPEDPLKPVEEAQKAPENPPQPPPLLQDELVEDATPAALHNPSLNILAVTTPEEESKVAEGTPENEAVPQVGEEEKSSSALVSPIGKEAPSPTVPEKGVREPEQHQAMGDAGAAAPQTAPSEESWISTGSSSSSSNPSRVEADAQLRATAETEGPHMQQPDALGSRNGGGDAPLPIPSGKKKRRNRK